MKKLIVIILILLLLCGCKTMPDEYQFKNANDSIISVELLYNPYFNEGYHEDPFELICILDDISAKEFMDQVITFETQKCITPPPGNYGFYVARVTYSDGDIELFGTRHIEYVESGDTPSAIGAYVFDGDEFEILINEYIEKYGSENLGQGNGSVVPTDES